MAAQVYYIKLTALTPVHAGVENEKHWKPGLDSVIQNDRLYVINLEKVMQKAIGNPGWIDELSLSVSQARIDEFLRKKNIRPAEVASHAFAMPAEAGRQDVRPFIRSGGRPFVPGSSLKGAIRSAMIHHLGAPADFQKAEQEWFGQIGNNLMRFLQVGDGSFNKSKIVLTKILSSQLSPNPDSNWTGWKHQSTGMQRELSPRFFSTCYETIARNETVYLRMSFQADALRIAQNADQFNANHKRLFPAGVERENLISMLNRYTLSHLEREIGFFKTFRPEIHGDLKLPFEKLLNDLKQATENTSNTAYLRMGHGIGFHAITGDWQHKDHTSMVTLANDSKPRRERNARKTRKLVITGEDVWPMGFIRLDFIEEKDWREGALNKDKEWEAMKIQSAVPLAAATPTEVPKQEIEAPKPAGPEFKELRKIKQGDVVDAICIRTMPANPKMKEFKLLLTLDGVELQDRIFQLGYADLRIIEKLCKVKIGGFNKQTLKINNIEWVGLK